MVDKSNLVDSEKKAREETERLFAAKERDAGRKSDLAVIQSWVQISKNLEDAISKTGGYEKLKEAAKQANECFVSLATDLSRNESRGALSDDEFINNYDLVDKIIKELFKQPQIIVAIKYAAPKVHLPVDQFTGVDRFPKSFGEKEKPQDVSKQLDVNTVFIDLYQNFLDSTRRYMDIQLDKITDKLPEDDKRKITNLIKALDWRPKRFSEENFKRWRLMEDIKKVYELQKYCEILLYGPGPNLSKARLLLLKNPYCSLEERRKLYKIDFINPSSPDIKQQRECLEKIIARCESGIFLLDRLYEMRKKQSSFVDLPWPGRILRIAKRLNYVIAIVGVVLSLVPGLQIVGLALLVVSFVLPLALKFTKWAVRRFYYHRPLTIEQKQRGISNVVSTVITLAIMAIFIVIAVVQQVPVFLKYIMQIPAFLLNVANSIPKAVKIVQEFMRDTLPTFNKIAHSVRDIPGKVKIFYNKQLERIFSAFGRKPEQVEGQPAVKESEKPVQNPEKEGPKESKHFTPM